MKYIDARTPETLKKGVMEFLNLNEDELEQIFETIDSDVEKEPWGCVDDFLSDYIVDESLEYIQMFHLTRRLNGTDLTANNNLEQLLLQPSPLSDFFKKYDVTFTKGEGHIDMWYKGEHQLLDDEFKYSHHGNMQYVRWRLGYNQEQDFCVNGFALRTHLEKNSYYLSLSRCPELVDNIERLLDIKGMSSDFKSQSKYYCIEYLIPMSEVIFDMGSNAPTTNEDKTFVFVSKAIVRLYDVWKQPRYIFDHDNLILRLADDAMVKPEWFKNAEELTI